MQDAKIIFNHQAYNAIDTLYPRWIEVFFFLVSLTSRENICE